MVVKVMVETVGDVCMWTAEIGVAHLILLLLMQT
jgi:hypothetical protein